MTTDKQDERFNATVRAYFLERFAEYCDDDFHCRGSEAAAERAMTDILDQVKSSMLEAKAMSDQRTLSVA